MSAVGTVYIVGAGPGDPELITVRGLRLLRQAEVVLYDHLVSQDLLGEVPSLAQRIYVGKVAGKHSARQEEINRLLVEKAREGLTVVRLKGGDPFVFGRVGEEIEYLRNHGVPYQVVPGVTAASAIASQCGFSLTHRRCSSVLSFVTGHRRGDRPLDLPFSHLSGLGGTLVVYMGLGALAELREGLLGQGMDPATPVLLGERVTWPEQRLVVTTVGGMVEARDREGLAPPVLVVIGSVVELAMVNKAGAADRE